MSDSPPAGDLPSPRLGLYEVLGPLGKGGMSTVFEGRHVALGARVAIKVLRPTFGSAEVDVKRTLREGRAAAAVRHPNVVSVLDVGTQGGVSYLVMELLEGEDLAKRIERGPVDVSAAADLLLPVASGVAAVHDAGVVHRDLKPSNILLARRYRGVEPVVVDFGISRCPDAGGNGSSARAIPGTVPYMAPELLRGAEATAAADQYALGVIAYECVTGGPPFWGKDQYELLHAIMTARVVPPSELNPEVPAAFDAVVLRAMSRDPAERFPSVRAFGMALLPFATAATRAIWGADLVGRAVTTQDVVVHSRTMPPVTATAPRRKPWVLPLAAVMGTGALAVAWAARTTTPAVARTAPAPSPVVAQAAGVAPAAVRVEATASAQVPAVSREVRHPAATRVAGATSVAHEAAAPPPAPPPVPLATTVERGTGNMPIVE